VSEAASPAPAGIWIQARQHAWESGSGWVARGLVEWLLGEDADASWLRLHAELFVVPIMDVDNAATGNGGKEADPRDHNRDWDDGLPPKTWSSLNGNRTTVEPLPNVGPRLCEFS
jgi:murein tripeptide amidase MpaA